MMPGILHSAYFCPFRLLIPMSIDLVSNTLML